MSGEVRNIFKVASIYMTTIIGAGFASGQEIVQFFSNYSKGGFYGVIFAGFLFAAIGYLVLDRVYKERIRNYEEFLYPAVGYFWGRIMEIAVSLFMISVFCIMIAGSANILKDKFYIPYSMGIIIMSIICTAAILTDIRGIISMSTFVSPILILGIIIIGIYIIVCRDTSVFSLNIGFKGMTNNWFFSALIYVGYNSIIAVVVLCSLLPYLKTRRTGIVGGITGGVLLCAAAFIINYAIYLFYPGAALNELPVLSIVKRYGKTLNVFYSFVLWLAMFSSAVTSGYCFADRVRSKIKINLKVIALATCAIALPLSSIGFSKLIATIYPLFGYLGLFMVFLILLQALTSITVPVQIKNKYKTLRNK